MSHKRRLTIGGNIRRSLHGNIRLTLQIFAWCEHDFFLTFWNGFCLKARRMDLNLWLSRLHLEFKHSASRWRCNRFNINWNLFGSVIERLDLNGVLMNSFSDRCFYRNLAADAPKQWGRQSAWNSLKMSLNEWDCIKCDHHDGMSRVWIPLTCFLVLQKRQEAGHSAWYFLTTRLNAHLETLRVECLTSTLTLKSPRWNLF